MKLVNYTLKYLAIILLAVLSVWATIFYFSMLDEVYDSLDDGLENYKMLIIDRAELDSSILYKTELNEGNYVIRQITRSEALASKDNYRDSLINTLNEQDSEPFRILSTAFESGGEYYELTILSSMVEEDDLIESLFFAIIWLYVSLLAVILLVNNVLLRRLWKPFYQILNELNAFQVGSDSRVDQVRVNTVSEFKELQTSVDGLMKRSTAAYRQQKQFIENASHELQTPLAISINKLELMAEKAAMHTLNPDDLGEVTDMLQRLVRLNRSLLQLSKIENRQFQNRTEVFIDEMVKEQVQNFQDLADHKKVTITVQESEKTSVQMDSDLANIMVTNLIKNALVHNEAGGKVMIGIANGVLKICNTGKKESLQADRVFGRFYRESTEQNGTGLGLAIVKAIADSYGFKLHYSYSEGQHCMEAYF